MDLKSDGFLDAHEWSHAFSLAKPLAQERFLTHKPYQELIDSIGRNLKPLRLLYRQLDARRTGLIDFSTGVAVLIKFVRETLDLPPHRYSDVFLEDMARPFGELVNARMALRHGRFTEAIKQRHQLRRQAAANKVVPTVTRD